MGDTSQDQLGTLGEELRTIAASLIGFELVEGYRPVPPRFEPFDARELGFIAANAPSSYREFVAKFGFPQSMDTAAGLVFLLPAQVRSEKAQEYGPLIEQVGGVKTYPVAACSDGSLYLLGVDDEGVWHATVYSPTGFVPRRVAGSFVDFLSLLTQDWRGFASRSDQPAVLR